MFEHMMFKGSTNLRADAHGQYLAALGGYAHATTDEDSTHYLNTLPSEYFDFAIQLEAERMRNLMFRPEMIAGERDVIKDEIRRQDSQPIPRGFARFLEVAFTKHPYAWTASGYAKELDATTSADLEKFYATYYQPNNALLVVTGNVTLAAVKASAEKHFGPIAKAADPPRPAADATEPEQTKARRETVEAGPIGLTMIGFHIPAAKHPDIYALQVASIVLGVGDSSRLKQRLKAVDDKTKRPLALDGGIQAFIREHPGIAVVVGAYAEPAQAAGVESALFDELAKLGQRGPTPDELRKAKAQVQASFTFSLENAQGLAEAIGRSWILVGDATAFLRDIDEIEKVTSADVARVVKKYMVPERATIVVVPPAQRAGGTP
jgi:zinc protease